MPKKRVSPRYLVNTQLGIWLSSHEKLCAERMKHLIKSIDELNKKVSKLSDDVSRGKGAVAVLVGLGTILAACIGFFNFR